MTKLTNKIITLSSRRTSMRLCCKEWSALDDICLREKINRNSLIDLIENNKDRKLGLAYATRLFLLMYYKSIASHSKRKIISRVIKELI